MINIPQVVTIAGVDSSGGAGINADVKTFHNQKVYSATIVTGLTAQNTYGVQAILPTNKDFILAQFDSVFSDLEILAAKTGALFDIDQVKAVIQGLKRYKPEHLVVDPVMIAKGGAALLTGEAIDLIKEELLPLAELVTPNLEEAEIIVGYPITDEKSILKALYDIQELGVRNVLVKGGHNKHELVRDYLLVADGSVSTYESKRLLTERTHGTGDTLSSYITAHLALGENLKEIMADAKIFITEAISKTINVGHGHGPLNHWVTIDEE